MSLYTDRASGPSVPVEEGRGLPLFSTIHPSPHTFVFIDIPISSAALPESQVERFARLYRPFLNNALKT